MCMGGGSSGRTALSARTSALQRRGNTDTKFDKVYNFGKAQTLTRYVKDPNYATPKTISSPWGGTPITLGAKTKVPNSLGGFGGGNPALANPTLTGKNPFGSGPRISSKNPLPPAPDIIMAPPRSAGAWGGIPTAPAGYRQETKKITNAADYKAFTGKDWTSGTYSYVGRTVNGAQGRVAIADEGKIRRQTRQARTNTSIVQGNSAIKRSRRGGLRIDNSSSQLPSGGSGVNVPV